jgi:hypothetical protein
MINKLFIFILALFLLAGCETLKVNSSKLPTYDQKLGRVLVSVTAENYYLDSSLIGKQLAEKLAQRGIMTEVVVHKKLELEDPVKSALISFKPTQVLNIIFEKQEDIDFGKYGVSRSGYFKSTISDVNMGGIIWNSDAKLSLSNVGLGFDDKGVNAKKFADGLIKKLVGDGLLSAQ